MQTEFPSFNNTIITDTIKGSGVFESLSTTDLVSIFTYWIAGFIGIFGNGLVCIVFKVIRSTRSQVNLLILNQAVTDLTTSVLMIIYGTTRIFRDFKSYSGVTGQFLCRFWWSRFFVFSCFAISTYNLTTISIERYIAVVHPLSYKTIFNARNVKVYIILMWLFPPLLQYIFPIAMYEVQNEFCQIQSTWTFVQACIAGVALFSWEYFFPCLIMSSAYIKVFVKINKKSKSFVRFENETHSAQSTDNINKDLQRQTKSHKRKKNITVTLFLLFLIYFICWTPNQFTFLQFNMGGHLDFSGAWYNFTVISAFLNTAVNPFIYALKSSQFQKGLKMICTKGKVSPLSLEECGSKTGDGGNGDKDA